MVCKKCGEVLPDYARKCPVCGALQGKSKKDDNFSKLNPGHSHEDDCSHWDSVGQNQYASKKVYRQNSAPGMREAASPEGFFDKVKWLLCRLVDFEGIANRREFFLGVVIFMLGIALELSISENVGAIVVVLLIVPYVAVSVRRAHDMGMRAWYAFLQFIPVMGAYIFYFLLLRPGIYKRRKR